MKFLSVCSGIEAASVAWTPLGWKAVAFSEIEPFPCALLAHHYQDTPNWGDMTKYKEWPDVSIDLLCGGTPCQSFSVAGLRKGLDDPRGNLMLTFGAIASKYRPQWLVWENVPGVLSSNGGRDFGAFLGMLGQLGYGFAYRVLDAQYFGVAQRRRRVFVVGCLGDWRCAAAVLFERHSLQGHPAPRRQAGQAVAGTFSARTEGGGGFGTDFECGGGLQVAGTMKACKDSGGWSNSADHAAAGYMVPVGVTIHGTDGTATVASYSDTAQCLRARPPGFLDNSSTTVVQQPVCLDTTQITSAANYSNPKACDPCHPLAAQAHVPCIAFPERMSGTQCASTENLAPSMGAANPTAVAFAQNQRDEVRMLHVAGALAAEPGMKQQTYVAQPSMQVRRLTPEECEALQGFPRGYSQVPNRGKPAADGPRYKALGNSWAVPNVRWIGQRIDAVQAILNQQMEAA